MKEISNSGLRETILIVNIELEQGYKYPVAIVGEAGRLVRKFFAGTWKLTYYLICISPVDTLFYNLDKMGQTFMIQIDNLIIIFILGEEIYTSEITIAPIPVVLAASVRTVVIIRALFLGCRKPEIFGISGRACMA